jgi:murein DD-endopeptidase MepM/ murein hydrolase activator NlpD
MVPGSCPRCARSVAIHDGRPIITTRGVVELWHDSCWNLRDMPLEVQGDTMEIAAEVVAPMTEAADTTRVVSLSGWALLRRRHAVGAAAGSAALAFAAIYALSPDVAAAVDVLVATLEVPDIHVTNVERESIPPKSTGMLRLEERHPLPKDRKGRALSELYPTLLTWVHPISGADELFPPNPGRHYGALRVEISNRPECGQGHCGVDLDGPRGRPLIAVAAGVIARAERRPDGGDGMSGRYVRIQHDDGSVTTYMHMDQLAPGLEVGDRVEQGQYIGTLGMTAVQVPHLHFALELPNTVGLRDLSSMHYADPAPFLLRSSIVRVPDRRRPQKPVI